MFNYLSNIFVNILIENKIIEEDELEIYRYGFETLIYFIVNILAILFIGICFNKLIQSIIFLMYYCTLRQFTGGYHAKSYKECTLIFILIYLFTIFIDDNLNIIKYEYLLILAISLSSYIIYRIAPLEHRNKALSKSEKKKYKCTVKKILIVIVLIFIFFMATNYLNQYIIYSFFAIMWIAILLIAGIVLEQ